MARITIYCPDTHLSYRGTTPETDGVGGGVTARIHLGRALARAGHDVTVVVNTSEEHVTDGARFVPLADVTGLTADVVVLNSSGGALSLEPAHHLSIEAKTLTLWVHGVSPVSGLEAFRFDRVVVPSRFIAGSIGAWSLGGASATVIPNGFHRYPVEPGIERDPHRLAYTSHPAKGLEAALAVLRILRASDSRYTLHLYGGAALWGQDSDPITEDGVTDHGLVGQPFLQSELRRAGFALHLQAIPEAFSISVSEAMDAGAIPVVSPVGALAERIVDAKTGIVIPGDHERRGAHEEAARRIAELVAKPRMSGKIRRRAAEAVVDWDQVAAMWTRTFFA